MIDPEMDQLLFFLDERDDKLCRDAASTIRELLARLSQPSPAMRCSHCGETAFEPIASPKAVEGESVDGESVREALSTIAAQLGEYDHGNETHIGLHRSIGNALTKAGMVWDHHARRFIWPATLSTVEGMGLREALEQALQWAFIAGATDVHRYWTNNPGEAPQGDPEFGEAAGDYAKAALDPYSSAARIPNELLAALAQPIGAGWNEAIEAAAKIVEGYKQNGPSNWQTMVEKIRALSASPKQVGEG